MLRRGLYVAISAASVLMRSASSGDTKITLGDYCDHYLGEVAPMSLENTTIASYRRYIDLYLRPDLTRKLRAAQVICAHIFLSHCVQFVPICHCE